MTASRSTSSLLDTAGKNHPLGATWSYCNSGYSILGRVIEVLTGKTWDAAMSELLYQPLGLTHTVTLPEDAILYGAAVGHVDVGDEQIVTPAWLLPRGIGPAGLITARAEDVLAFARLHMAGGVAADGTRAARRRPPSPRCRRSRPRCPTSTSSATPGGSAGSGSTGTASRLYGHDGNTLGQAAFLRIHPESGVAVTLLTNGGNTHDFYEDLYREIFAELSGLDMKHPVAVPDEPVEVDVTPFVGTYERASVRMEVLRDGGRSASAHQLLGPLAELEPNPVEEYPLVALDEDLFVLRAPGTQTWMTVTFYSLPTGEEYVHFGARATPKVSDRCRSRPLTRRPTRPRNRWRESQCRHDHRPRRGRDRSLVGSVRRLVECESPSSDHAAVARSAAVVAATRRRGARRRSRADRRRRRHAPAVALRLRDARAGARAPRHGVAARLAGAAPVRRARRHHDADPAAST